MPSAAGQTSTGRIKALAAAAAAMTAKDAAADLAQNGPSARISLTAGHSESESTELTASRTHAGSVLSAGKDLAISATGGGEASNIDIVGSDVRASGKVLLAADNQVNLLAAHDAESQHSKNSSHSASVGIAAEINSSGYKVGYTASVSASRGNVDGEGTTQINSHVVAGDILTIRSGGDTNLKGAVASGNQVVADIKGNLNIESLQDTATLDAKRQSLSVSGTVGAGAGLSVNLSQSKAHNDYASVQEQSGLRAGDGGFQIAVARNTDLKGGVISSSESAIDKSRNSFTTSTLSFSDIQNRDSHDASGISLGGNLGKNQTGDTFSPSLAPGVGKVSGSQSGVTRSGISGATVTVSDQQSSQALVSLNRDVTTGKDTAQALTKAWTGAQALDDVGAQMQITSAAMPRIAKEIGDYATGKQAELIKQGNPDDAAKWAEGGVYRVAAHAALGAMGGALNGAIGAATAAVAAPTIDKLQTSWQSSLNNAGFNSNAAEVAAKLIASAAAGAIGGAVGGTVALTAGLNADANNRQLHAVEVKVIQKKTADFAKVLYGTADLDAGRLAQAQAYLVYAALADVDSTQMQANILMGLQHDDNYLKAKIFLTSQSENFVTDGGQTQRVFTTKKNEFYDSFKYSYNNSDIAYRDFFWNTIHSNVPLPNSATAAEKQVYSDRESERFRQDLKNAAPGLFVAGISAGMGRIAARNNEKMPSTRSTEGAQSSASPVIAEDATLIANIYRDGEMLPTPLSTSSKIVIRADPNKTTTVIGTFADDTNNIINKQLEYPKTLNHLEPKKGGFNLLNVPDELYEKLGPDRFWKEVNVPFLDAAVSRNDKIYLATKPTPLNTRNPANSDGLSGFGREVNYLLDKGYTYDVITGKMVPQGGSK
ncbi:MAG: Polymorphic rane protein Filamentous hemagglutinin/Adhesin [Massilia sp.]|jgi:hypothetical protein|nr:Polymorphic rane protein Filamentous hemagglutinin/Adhesin [Massilia sp.]